jgi:putative colanic acid biosynthesis acetyltransferase WcaF
MKDCHSSASFSIQNRLARVLWSIAWLTLCRWTPPPLHGWRSFVARVCGAKVGRQVHIYPGARIWAPWNLEVGDQAGIASGASIYNQAKISIGRKSVISQGAHLCAGTHDYTDPGFPLTAKPIHIGDHAWIAAEAFVHGGVTINEGCVVGARSVVIKDMPAWTVCAGHPCKPIKPREWKI